MTELTKGLPIMYEFATPLSYGSSVTAVFLGLNVDEWGIVVAVVGCIGVAATFAFNAWFKMKYGR